MTLEDLNYLASTQGQADYQKYYTLSDSELDRLILKGEIRGALVSLIKNRRLAASKFSHAEELFFDKSALEQATTERIARHIAKRFSPQWQVVDLGCGLGANSMFLAEHGCQVLALDKNPARLKMAQLNAKVYGVSKQIKFQEADFLENLPQGVDAIFLDPARNLPSGIKTRSLKNSQPNIIELLPRLLAITPQVAVKISPAFDYEELKELPEEPEVEVISEDGVNKVVMLWFGSFKRAERSALVIKKETEFSLQAAPNSAPPQFSKPQTCLYLLDKAISKARLVDELASKYLLARISSNTSLLTSKDLVSVPATRLFKVLSHDSFSLKKFSQVLKKEKIERAEIIARGVPMTDVELRRRLKLKEGGEHTIFLFKYGPTDKYYILANNK